MNKRRFKSHSIKFSLILFLLLIPLIQGSLFAKVAIPEGEILLIVRGDDIGFSHGANMAFKKAFDNGILTSAELMVPPPWFDEAVKILKERPNLDVGIHLTLTCEWMNYRWGPVGPKTDSTPGFIDREGNFYYRTAPSPYYDKIFTRPYSFLGSHPKLSEVEKELRAQIELAMKKIPYISHISCHMGAASVTPQLKSLVEELSMEYGLVPDWKFEDNSLSIFSVPLEKKVDSLASILKNLTPGFWYLVVHPGLDTPEMRAISSPTGDPDKRMAQHRAEVTEALTSERIKKIIEERNIKLVNHKDLIKAGILNED